MDLDGREKDRATKILVRRTYKVTILMLLIGQLQVFVVMEIAVIKESLEFDYYVSLLNFLVSFISIQLYVFFYRILEQKSKWKRILADIWTYEVNTISIMKRAKRAPYICLIVSWVLTFMVMGISVMYANMAARHRHGLFMGRHNIIRWSERVFVLTCLGITLCSEMKRVSIEFPSLFIYTMMSNIFVVIFAASIRKPNFYQLERIADHILIGQLYYLNFYALYMGYVWLTAATFQLADWNVTLASLTEGF